MNLKEMNYEIYKILIIFNFFYFNKD